MFSRAYLVSNLASAALTGAAMTSSSAADAVPYIFAVSGSYNATFQLDSNPVPNAVIDGFRFEIRNQPNPQDPGGILDMFFYNGFENGGFYFYEPGSRMDIIYLAGPQLYSGTERVPVLRRGTFQLHEYGTDKFSTLNISPAAQAVLEPTTWLTMILGLGAVGYTMRRKSALHSA